MAIKNNRLTAQQYEQNFADIHLPFENRTAAVVEEWQRTPQEFNLYTTRK